MGQEQRQTYIDIYSNRCFCHGTTVSWDRAGPLAKPTVGTGRVFIVTGEGHGNREAITRGPDAAELPPLGTSFALDWQKSGFSGSTRQGNSAMTMSALPNVAATGRTWLLST